MFRLLQMSNINSPHQIQKIEIELLKLKEEHRKLDSILSNIENPILDPLLLRRLKKEKLILKDRIQKITSQVTPNIIA